MNILQAMGAVAAFVAILVLFGFFYLGGVFDTLLDGAIIIMFIGMSVYIVQGARGKK